MKTGMLVYAVLVITKLTAGAFVDPGYKLVDWEGWGVRISFWSNVLGGLNEDVQKEIVTAIFSPERLNLNIVRYTIGATIPGDRSCGDFTPGADAESFQDRIDGPFLESRDARARKILLAAKAHGVDTFEAFAFSPPSWMTKSNCSKGNPDGAPLHDNFDPKYAYQFADYMTNVVKYYHDKHNLSFTYLCLFYEPSSGSWSGSAIRNEGCNMELGTMVQVIKTTHAALQAKNLTFCGLSVAHEKYASTELNTQTYFKSIGLHKLYKKISFLGNYGDGFNNLAEFSTMSSKLGVKLELKDNYKPATRFPNMTQGTTLAKQIVNDIRVMAVSSWGFSEAVPYHLIQIDYSDAQVENMVYTTGYYSFMQFTKYIRKGYSIIHISDEDSVAAYSSASNTLVIVLVNGNSVPVNKSIDLSSFSSLGNILAYRTSPFETHVSIIPPSIQSNNLVVDLPENSVTTIQISSAVPHQRSNLLRNGDFESSEIGEIRYWFLVYGERPDKGINGNYVYRGSFSGNIDYTQSKLTLMQNATARNSKVYHLSAWCASDGDGVTLGILVNGQQASEIPILSNVGYRLYGLSVNADEGDTISVYLHSEMGNHAAQIDDVVLH